MQQHKIVVVDDADEMLKDREDDDRGGGRSSLRPRDLVQRYAEAPCDSATLVLRAEKWNKGKLDKAVERVGVVIKCDAPSPAEAAAWCVARARKAHDHALERDAASALVDKIGPDLGRLDGELAKLSAAVGVQRPITLAIVHELVGFTREETVWQIQDLVLQSDPETVLGKIRDLVTVSRVPPLLCRFALIDLARKLHGSAAGFASGASQAVLDANLKLWGPAKARILSIARRADPARLAELLRESVDADHAAKSGGSSDEVRDLERLAVRFASVLR
jgi:DNA polymerase-3 subunit delta